MRALPAGAGPAWARPSRFSLLSGGAAAGEQWGWLGVRIRDLTEQETEELSEEARHPRGLRRADRPGHEGDAGRGGRDCATATWSSPSTGGRSSRREPSSAWWAPRRRAASIALVVLREQDRQELRVRVGRMPPEVVADRVAFEFGFYVRDVGRGAQPGRPRSRGSRWWRASPSGAPPPAAGLLAGDRIVAVNDVEVETVEALPPRGPRISTCATRLRLRVEREGEPVTLTLPPAQPSSR